MFKILKEMFCKHVWYEPYDCKNEGEWRVCVRCGKIETLKLKFFRTGNNNNNVVY